MKTQKMTDKLNISQWFDYYKSYVCLNTISFIWFYIFTLNDIL